ncbi:hypothetical protein CVT26_008803 [Gymnopilus dilepis]|uniref:ABM domain-containing protein n=1 Tax=Gymnopilus dilepis TaxID=231916 RepID=A0A409WUG6_9AGAR|nr:hypothetical protein CVT26_008803 [Gymnopilus dilepis]
MVMNINFSSAGGVGVVPLAPEIIWFSPSDTFLQHPYDVLCAVSRASAKNGPGLIAHYQGDELEADSESKIWVSVWRSLAHHRTIMEHEAYVDLILPMLEAMDGSTQPSQILISSMSDFELALSAPLTQFIYITLRPWHDRGFELVPLVEKLKREMRGLQGCLSCCWGPSVEKDSLEIGVIGWRSVQVGVETTLLPFTLCLTVPSNFQDRNSAMQGPLQCMLADIRQISAIHIRDAVLTCTF